MVRERLEDYVRTIPDFPEPGIMFRDVTSVIQDADGLKLAIDEMAKLCGNPDEIDAIDRQAHALFDCFKRFPPYRECTEIMEDYWNSGRIMEIY